MIVIAVLVAYAPALTGQLLWDDDGHVTRPDLRSFDGLWRIWTEFGATQQYYPVLHSAFWLEHRLWGDAVVGYHLLNVLLHATAASLLGVVLRRLAVPGAWFAALLFALHPVCVESVAWISEQKNTLSAVLYLSAALAYLRFDEHRRPRCYALATTLFALALLTKTVTASLPAALLVVAWWRHGYVSWRRDVVPLLPWFAGALALGMVTAHVERELIGAKGEAFTLTAVERVLLATRVPWFYLGKLLWPLELVFIYPRWTIDASAWWQWLFPVATVTALAVAFWQARLGRRTWLAVALLYGGTLFPVLGFVNVFPFLFSYVADHFQYLASLAVFALAGSGVALAVRNLGRAPAIGLLASALCGYATLTWRQAANYQDEGTLWRATLADNPDCWMAHNNLALVLGEAGQTADAITHLEAALRLRPDFPEALNNLADRYVDAGRPTEAQRLAERALVLLPKYPAAHNTLGRAQLALGRAKDASASFEAAVRLNPRFATAWNNLGVASLNLNRVEDALRHFAKASELAPDYAPASFFAGATLARLGRLGEAVPKLQRAVDLDPDYAVAHLQLALALRQLGRLPEAEAHYRTAISLDPRLGQARPR